MLPALVVLGFTGAVVAGRLGYGRAVWIVWLAVIGIGVLIAAVLPDSTASRQDSTGNR